MIDLRSPRWIPVWVVAGALLLRLDLVGTPFIQYFSNREVQNALPLRLFQEGRYTVWNIPTEFTESYGAAEFQMLPWVVGIGYDALTGLRLAHLPAPGDAEGAAAYYRHVALLGRTWSLLMSLWTLLTLWRLVRDGWSETAASYSVAAYGLLPYNRFFDQLFIAEPTLMALTFFGMWQLWQWSGRPSGGWLRFLAAAAAFALVLLLKVSHVWIGLPIAYLFWRRQGWRALWQWTSAAFGAAVLAPAAYFYLFRGSWVSGGGLDGYAWTNTVRTLTDGSYLGVMVPLFLYRHLWAVWTPVGALLAGMGFWHAWTPGGPRRPLTCLLTFWAAGWIYYWFMAGQMSLHFYYQAPSVPLAAAFMGAAAAWLLPRVRPLVRAAVLAAVAAGLLVLGDAIQRVNDQDSRYWRGPWCATLLEAGLAADRRVPPRAHLVIGCRGPIYYMLRYYAHREATSLLVDDGDQEAAPARLEELRREGATFYLAAFGYDGPRYNGVVLDRSIFGELPIARHLLTHYEVVEETPTYILFDLRAARTAVPGYH